MIIILEGPDGAGKTTLAEKLKQQTGYTYLRRAQPKTEEDKKRMMEEYIQVIKSGKNCIFDRCWYSELIYGPIMRDASVITYPQMYQLERLIAKNGAILIYCTAPEATLWKRCMRRGEDYITKHEDFRKICKEYDTLMYDVPHLIPVTTYVYQDL